MKYLHGRAFLLLALVVLLPIKIEAVATTTTTTPLDICAEALSGVETAVKIAYSSTSINAGDTVELPILLTNSTRMPMNDLRLLVKVTRLGKPEVVTSIASVPEHYVLAPGYSTTTHITWTSTANYITGSYRLDVFPLPSGQFVDGRILSNAPAVANLMIRVKGKAVVSPLGIDENTIRLGGMSYHPNATFQFERGEGGAFAFTINNLGQAKRTAALSYKVYPYMDITEKSALFATTSAVTVEGKSNVSISLPIPLGGAPENTVVIELIDQGQQSLFVLNYGRAVAAFPLAMLSIVPSESYGGPQAFALYAGRSYKIFACPLMRYVTDTGSISFSVQDMNAKSIFENTINVNKGDKLAPFIFEFLSKKYQKDFHLIEAAKLGGKEELVKTALVCNGSNEGECTAPPGEEKEVVGRGGMYIAALGLLVITLALVWKKFAQHAYHER